MRRRLQWQGPTGLILVAVFFLFDVPALLSSTRPSHGVHLRHVLFVPLVLAGLCVCYSGLRRGDFLNRLLSLSVLLFFLAVVVLLRLRWPA